MSALGWLGLAGEIGLTERVDDRLVPAPRHAGSGTHRLGAGRPDRGNGFIAAFVGGLVVGPTVERVGEQLIRFTETEGQLLNLSVFFIFGVFVLGAIQHLSWEVALYAILSLTVIRMLPVALSLYGTHLRGISVLFAGWFGPRGWLR